MSAGWLGLDLGGSKILGVVVAADRRTVLVSRRIASQRDDGPEVVLDRACQLGRDLVRAAAASPGASRTPDRRVPDSRMRDSRMRGGRMRGGGVRGGGVPDGGVQGVGIGFAGLVDHDTGIVGSSVILPGWDGMPLQARATAALGLPCVVDNDATLTGWGEFVAAGEPPGLNMVVLTVGTGIGGAILIDGAVYRGRCGTSAEFGNTAIDWQGRDCISGNRGSLNTLASGTALCRRAAELAGGDPTSALAGGVITGERIAAAAARGDAVARRAIDEAARALGAGIANVINVFNPDRVVLAGGLCNLGPAYLDAVRDEAQRRAFPVAAQHAELRLAALGDLAGAHGAACYAAARLGVSAGAAPRTDGTVHLLDGGSRAAQA